MMGRKIAVEDLSLRLAGLDAPFAPVGPERNLKPEDWAWQFLRLDTQYQQDYANALDEHGHANESPRGSFWVTDHHAERKLRVAEQYCRNHYGLSTWMDPECSDLPPLKSGESWFFPLIRTVDSPVMPGGTVPMEDVFSYYFVPSGRGLGDRRRTGVRKVIPSDPNDRSKVWFAIDCSVPLAGQMKSVEALSRVHKAWYLQLKLPSQAGTSSDSRVVPLDACPWFKSENFTAAAAIMDSVAPSAAWYAICVDVLGPIKEQLDSRLAGLSETNLELCEKRIAQEPILKRFRSEITGPRDEDGRVLSDGSSLKGAVICAQLAHQGMAEGEIAEFIYRNADPNRKSERKVGGIRHQWESNLSERVVEYLKRATKFINGDYRWLIHAQKPDA